MATFAQITTAEAFDAIRRDEARLRPGVNAILAARGLAAANVERFADGSLPVYAVGTDRVLKLYPPVYLDERDLEARVLGALEGKLPIPTPRLDSIGEHDGWGFVLMERLRGESLAVVWPHITPQERLRLVARLGEALAALHAIRDPSLSSLPPPSWARFVADQRSSSVSRQRARGLDGAWLEQIDAFLASVALDESAAPVLLHTEVMREHLLVTRGPEGWALSGLFDFEPAMCGAPEYELASVGIFVTAGDAALLRALLLAYGYRADELDEALSRRVLGYALLHRYSHLRWYLERVPPPAGATTLDALARCWFGVSPS